MLKHMALEKDGAQIEPALWTVYQTLQEFKPGQLYGTDQLSFMIDANLNEFVSFLTDIVRKSKRQELKVLAIRLILQIAKVRSNPEDLLIASVLITEHKIKADYTADMKFL
jgi:hypothetical protein